MSPRKASFRLPQSAQEEPASSPQADASRFVRSQHGSLPLRVRISVDGKPVLAPAQLFAPVHLKTPGPVFTPKLDPNRNRNDDVETAKAQSPGASGRSARSSTRTDGAADATSLTGSEAELATKANQMLMSGVITGTEFADRAPDASYDFDQYVYLGAPGSSYSPLLNTTLADTHELLSAVEDAMRQFVEGQYSQWISLGGYPVVVEPGTATFASRTAALAHTLTYFWASTCLPRAADQLTSITVEELDGHRKFHPSETVEEWFGRCLILACYKFLQRELVDGSPFDYRVDQQIKDYIGTGQESCLRELLTVTFWQDRTEVALTLMTAPSSQSGVAKENYSFDPFPTSQVLFGLRVIHRQTWQDCGAARGDLVKTIPLGPRESRKVSVKVARRFKRSTTSEQATSVETTSEADTSTKDTTEVVLDAAYKVNRHLEAEVSGGFGPVFNAKVSGSLSDEQSNSSKDTKSRLNETMQKTANRMKRDTKLTLSMEGEESYEETASSELTNPNDEVAITYLYRRLQQRFWVSTEMAEVNSVVFVAQPIPEWTDVGEDWIREHADVIDTALLDRSFAPVLGTIRSEPGDLSYTNTEIKVPDSEDPAKTSTIDVYNSAAVAGMKAAADYAKFTGGVMPDMIASGHTAFERQYERVNKLNMDQKRRQHQIGALAEHIRRNILHYMRAIWANEDYDERMQRLSKIKVPTAWVFYPNSPLPDPATSLSGFPAEVDGAFIPQLSSARPLTEVIDPVGPIGYLFNCAIYRLRDDSKLMNLHQALSYLRSTYAHFDVRVDLHQAQAQSTIAVDCAFTKGLKSTAVSAYCPRSPNAQYRIIYQSGLWRLVPENCGDPTHADVTRWPTCNVRDDGGVDVRGIYLWLDGAPNDGDVVMVTFQGLALRHVAAYAPRSTIADYTIAYRTQDGGKSFVWLLVPPGASPGDPNCLDWHSCDIGEDGSVDVPAPPAESLRAEWQGGIRLWFTGTPKDGNVVKIHAEVTGELEDPQLRLLQLMYPLPIQNPADEARFFNSRTRGGRTVVRDMAAVVPDIGLPIPESTQINWDNPWNDLGTAQQEAIRSNYHRYLMLRDTGELVTIDTGNLILDLEPSQKPVLEDFKRLHRYIDVMKEYEEYRHRQLEARRHQALLDKGIYGDPDIERVTVTDSAVLRDLIALGDETTEQPVLSTDQAARAETKPAQE